MTSNLEFRIPSLIEKEIEKLENCLNECKKEYSLIGLNQKQTNCVVKSLKNLLNEIQISANILLKNTVTSPKKILSDLLGRSKNILEGMDSQYKRLLFFNVFEYEGIRITIICAVSFNFIP